MDFVNTGLELPIVKMPTITPSMNNNFGSSFNDSVPDSFLLNEHFMVFYLYGHETSLNYVYLHF